MENGAKSREIAKNCKFPEKYRPQYGKLRTSASPPPWPFPREKVLWQTDVKTLAEVVGQ